MMNGSRPAVLPNLIENGPIVREEPLLRDSVKKPWAVITGRTESARTKVKLVAALIEQTLTRDIERLHGLTFWVAQLVVAKIGSAVVIAVTALVTTTAERSALYRASPFPRHPRPLDIRRGRRRADSIVHKYGSPRTRSSTQCATHPQAFRLANLT